MDLPLLSTKSKVHKFKTSQNGGVEMELGTNAIIFQNDKHMAPVKDNGDIVLFQ